MHSRLPLLIVIAALLILGLLVFFGVLYRVRQMAADLPRVIEHEMETSLNRQVRIKSIKIVSLDTAVISDLTINDRSEFGRKPFFSAPKVVVNLNTLRIIRGRPVSASISSIALYSPRITLVRNTRDVLNIQDLITRPPTPPAQRFRGRVEIHSGRATFVDYRARVAGLPQSNALNDVSGSVDFSPAHAFLADFSGKGTQGRVGKLSVSGQWAVDKPVTRLEITVREAQAKYWLDYFSDISSFGFEKGTFDAHALLSQPGGPAIIVRGTATIRDSSLVSPYLRNELSAFSANVSYVGTNIRMAGSGMLGKSPVNIEGRIAGLSPAVLDLRISSNKMDLNALQSAVKALPPTPYIRYTSPGTISATITGLAQNPLVTSVVNAPAVAVYGIRARAITARSYYKAGVIHVTGVAGLAESGSFESTGTIALKPLVIRMTARASNMRIAGTAVESANGNVEIRDRRVTVQRLLVNAVKGQITTRGQVTFGGSFNLGLTARNVDALTLLRPFAYTDFTGTADFDGTLTGTTKNPVLTGQVVARNGELRGIRYDFASGRLIATNTSVTLQNALIRQAQTEIATTGAVVVQRKVPPRFALQVRTRGVDLSQITAQLKTPLHARGVATANLRVDGTYPNLRISGEITAENGAVAGTAFDSARLQVETVAGRTVIREFFATRGASRLVGSGFVGPKGVIEINLAGENLDLSLLNEPLYPYAILQGPVTFSARIRGTISRPTLTGSFQAASPIVNEQQFESFNAGIAWNGAMLTISDSRLAGQGTTWSLPLATFTPATKAIELEGSVTAGSLARILAILKDSPLTELPQGSKLREFLADSPTPFSGAIDGSISLAGPLDNINGEATITASAVQMGSQIVDKVEIQIVEQRRQSERPGSSGQSVLAIRKVAITSPGVSLAATADFVNAKPSMVTATMQDTQIAILLAIIRSATFLKSLNYGRQVFDTAQSLKPPIAASLNATASITNIQKELTGTLSLTGTEVMVSNQLIGDLTASARFASKSVMVDQFQVAGPAGNASLSGTITTEGQVSLSGTVSQLSLAALRPFVHDNTFAGTGSLSFSVSGAMDNPTAQLAFNAANVVVSGVSFDSIAADRITIADNRIASDRVEIAKNGGSAVLSGSAPFSLTPPIIPADQPIMLTADVTDESLAFVKSLTDAVEDASGVFTASINITGTIEKPIINGPISLVDGFLKLKGFANSVTGVTVSARIVNSVLTLDSLEGTSSLGGTFTGSGSITMTSLTNGQVSLLLNANAFRLGVVGIGGPGGSAIFTTTGQLVVTDTVRSPVVQGTLVVSDAKVVIPAELVPTSIVLPALPISPQLTITLNLANNVVVQRGGLSAAVVGPVTLAGILSNPIVSGTVRIASGRLAYPTRTLNLRPGGTASFLFQPPSPAVISVDVEATTSLSAISPLTGIITRYSVALDITGPIGDLSIDVRTSPPGLSELEALAAIFGGGALESLLTGASLGSAFQEQLGQLLLGLALPGLFQPVEIGGISIGIEPGYEVPLQVSATAQLAGNLTLSYVRSVTGMSPVDVFTFAYTFSPQFALAIQFQGRNGVAQNSTTLVQYYKRF